MPARPIKRSHLGDAAYAAIKQLIVSGELPPGSRLVIQDLAERLQVSNSPIREAIHRLENEHWVVAEPFKGAVVPKLEPRELKELYEIRMMMELAAVTKGMADAPASMVDRLQTAQQKIAEALRAGDGLAYLAADSAFHQTLVDMAGNSRLSRMFATLAEQGRCFLLGRTAEAMKRHRDEPDSHAEILNAIRQGDSGRAIELLRLHFEDTFREIASMGE